MQNHKKETCLLCGNFKTTKSNPICLDCIETETIHNNTFDDLCILKK